MTNNTYREITSTKTITQTRYEITCGNCGRVWTADSLYGECCAICRTEKLEADFQASHKYLIGGRITAVVSDGDDYDDRQIKALVFCDEDGDYWKVEGDTDNDYGFVVSVKEYEGGQ